jgi:hypothetical protein
MRSALFWGITQHWVVILYQCFRTLYRSHLSTLEGRTNTLSWNISKGLSFNAVQCPRRAQISVIWSMAHNLLGTGNVYFTLLTFHVLLFYLNLKFVVKNNYMLSEQSETIRDWVCCNVLCRFWQFSGSPAENQTQMHGKLDSHIFPHITYVM